MASSPDSVLIGVRLQGLGDNTNTWGDDKLNNVLSVLSHSSHGLYSLAMTGDTTISETNYATDNETETATLVLTGSLSSAANLTIPSRERKLLVYNTTGQTITVKTSGGTGVGVPNGYAALLYCDATDVYSRNHYFDGTVRADDAIQNDELTTLSQVSALIAAQLTAGDGTVLVSADDTTRKFLEDAIAVSGDLTKTTTNPGANEVVTLGVSVPQLGLTANSVQTSGFAAVAGNHYPCVFAANGTITLPASASAGDVIGLALGDNSITYTVDPNSLNMNGSTSTLVFPSNNTYLLTYTDATQGWI